MNYREEAKAGRTPFGYLLPFQLVAKLLGQLPCRIVDGRPKMGGKWHRYHSVLCVFGHILYTCLCMVWAASRLTAKRKYLITLYAGNYALATIPILVNIVERVVYASRIAGFYDKLEAYDDKARATNNGRRDRPAYTWMLLGLFAVLQTVKLLMAPQKKNTAARNIIELVIAHAPTFVRNYFLFTYCMQAVLLHQRFRHLNRTIAPRTALPGGGRRRDDAVSVHETRRMHALLVHATHDLNASSGVTMFVTFATFFLQFLMCFYGYFGNVQGYSASHVFLVVMQAVVTCCVTHAATAEANRTERAMGRDTDLSKTTRYEDKIEALLYFHHNRLTFTAAGCFTLNIKLMVMMAMSITTYLVILLNM